MSFANALVNLVKSNLFLRIFSSVFLLGVLGLNFYVLNSQNHMWFFTGIIYAIIIASFWELNNIFFKNSLMKSIGLTILNLGCFFFMGKNFYLFFLCLITNIILFNLLLSKFTLSLKKTLAYCCYGAILLIAFYFIFFNLMLYPALYVITFFTYIFLISILTDTYAYICGRLFGRHKLAPYISPSKTIEGAIGAVILTTLTGIIIYYSLSFKLSFNYFLLIIIGGCIASQIGDLIESLLKRIGGVKDSSRIIPGHGGVLDRLDSFIFLIFIVQIFLWI